MGGEISFTPLGSLVDEARGISYGVVQPGQHVDDGVPIVRVTDIRHGRINQVDPLRVAPEIAEKYRRTVLRGGELLLTLVGTVGETAVVPASLAGWNTARAVAVLPVLDEPGPRWVQYALQTGSAREYIQTRLNTTVQATLNLGDVTTLPVPMPPREARERILRILGVLDDKIELNRKMNATLQAMARALFKSWFQEQSEAGAIDAKLVSDLAADGVLQVGDGYRAKNDEMASEGLPFARAGNIDNGFDFSGADLLGSPGVAKAGDKVSRACDVVFTSKGTVGRFAFVDPAMQPFVYSPQLCFWRSTNHEALNPFVLRQWMASRWFLDQVDRVKGQTDMAEYVSLRDQRAMRFPLATPESQAAIGTQLAELQRLVWSNERETHTLARIRDDLLPRLLSGELPVDAAERAVEEVA